MAVKIHLEKKTISLSVGDLVAEPLINVGRVAGLSAWTRMALGREAHVQHQRNQADRHEGYAREIPVRYHTTVDDFQVTIQGRLDGVYGGGRCVVEEIKSVVTPPLVFAALDGNSYPHYTEQLRLYCFFVAQEQHNVEGRLTFVNVADGARKEIEVRGPFDDCERLIADRVRALIGQALEEQHRCEQRRARSTELNFPHDRPRKYQDQMIAAVENALAKGRHLLVSAPSGIGKTAAALYPALKHALAYDQRIFFVTAKNTQQQIAWETLRRVGAVTAVQFRAREQMCINDVYACREEFCAHLRDFRAKLESTQVIERLLGQRLIAPEAMMEAGRGARLCPFELALLEAERTDVIVCDYNYVFDPQVYFRRFFQDADYSNAILIIDEAHNLVQRAMDYYSPSLQRQMVRDLMADLSHVEPSLAKEFRAVFLELDDLFKRTADSAGEEHGNAEKFLIESPREFFDELKPKVNRLAVRYLLDKVSRGRAVPDDPVDEFFSAFGQYCSVLAMEGEEFSHIFDMSNGESLKILCKDPSRQLAGRLEGFHSVIAMSATLAPMNFYREMLGFEPGRTDEASFASPFPRENRRILIAPNVLTTYRQRAANYRKIAGIIATTAKSRRGNYMALFPSYEFMRAVAAELEMGDWDLLVQEPKMTDERRKNLLDALKQVEPPKLVLAVQGGLFAEGVDYPGELLCGVVVVSPALPQVGFERELMRRYYEEQKGMGFEFAYLYPGMNRVIQSVGRLIRNETDLGVAVLVCQRFMHPQYSALFPVDWSESMGRDLISNDLEAELREFWSEACENRRREIPFTTRGVLL
jgi:DNA excision repair protein ERCC-2